MRWRSLVYRFSRFHHRDLCPAGLKRITSKTAQRRPASPRRRHVHQLTHNYDQMLQQTRFHFNCVATGKGSSCYQKPENTLYWVETPPKKNMETNPLPQRCRSCQCHVTLSVRLLRCRWIYYSTETDFIILRVVLTKRGDIGDVGHVNAKTNLFWWRPYDATKTTRSLT